MANRYNSSNFMTKEKVDGVNELDLVSNKMKDFPFSRPKSYYRITERDLKRPDLIAIRVYGKVEAVFYWQILMYYNNIHDIWNDMQIGDELVVPDERDIEDFLVFAKSRN